MTTLKEIKHAMKNPPPERLAKIEYRSHLYQAFGIIFVSIILIAKGFWYIVFALIFGVGISYSQGMTAYQKYKAIMSIKSPEKMRDYEKDISLTRRRSKIIESVIPNSKWLGILVSVMISIAFINPNLARWKLMLMFPLTIALSYSIFYFFILYWICYPVYKRRIKLK